MHLTSSPTVAITLTALPCWPTPQMFNLSELWPYFTHTIPSAMLTYSLWYGSLSRATPAPSQIRTSPKKPPLNLKYSQVIKTSTNPRARDPGKYQVIQSPDLSRDLATSRVSRDQ